MTRLIHIFGHPRIWGLSEAADIINRVRSWVGNKVAMLSGPTQMEIGQVEENWGWDEQEDWENSEVQAVGANTQCYRCHGWGHLGRECPTNSGKSKGKGKEGMKGKGKGTV